MRLHRKDRDWYIVSIEVDPEISGTPEASFDGEETWVEGIASDDNWAWLVAGPDFVAADTGQSDVDTMAVVHSTMTPDLRFSEDPVVVIEEAPEIEVWS